MPDENAPCAVEKYFLWQASPANKTSGEFDVNPRSPFESDIWMLFSGKKSFRVNVWPSKLWDIVSLSSHFVLI